MFLPEPAETGDHHDRALAELLELGMAAAREVQARLLAAEDAKAVCDLSLAFNRVSRAVRGGPGPRACRRLAEAAEAAEVPPRSDGRSSA